MTANEVVATVIDGLTALGVRYMLTGGYAANYWGVARSTRDADFVVEMTYDLVPQLCKRLGSGIQLERQLRFETITATQRIIFAVADIPFKIELFLLSDDPHDQSRFARRVLVRAWDRDVFVPTAEDLLIMKLRWSRRGQRSKDMDDARALVAIQGQKLKWDYIGSWCDRHGTRELLEELRRSLPAI